MKLNKLNLLWFNNSNVSVLAIIAIYFLVQISLLNAQSSFTFHNEIILEVKNNTNIDRVDELVSIEISDILKHNNDFNELAFIVYEAEKEISSQRVKNCIDNVILFVSDFEPNESKQFTIKYLENSKIVKNYKARTYAELAMKFNSKYENKKFVGDRFENFNRVVVPEIHTDHDALFKYEGPGWESEKVGYRFYLDWRNATDIFGKKIDELVLSKVGIKDVSAHKDSYHEMQEWGVDIFKVGSSLGIGSIGMMGKNGIERVSDRKQVICEILENGPIKSTIKTEYSDWVVDNDKYNLISNISITAGSRLSNVDLTVKESAANITTGLAKHSDTEFLKSDFEKGWQYIALYGKQTIVNDNLGIVLFYYKNDLIEQSEDDLNYYVSLKPNNDKVNYLFGAAWEKEKDGIKTKKEFIQYINKEIIKLNNPLIIEIQ